MTWSYLNIISRGPLIFYRVRQIGQISWKGHLPSLNSVRRNKWRRIARAALPDLENLRSRPHSQSFCLSCEYAWISQRYVLIQDVLQTAAAAVAVPDGRSSITPYCIYWQLGWERGPSPIKSDVFGTTEAGSGVE